MRSWPFARLIIVLAAFAVLAIPNAGLAEDDPPHGHYLGSYLICDDGYKSVGGRCVKLPSVTNGHYFGSYLICDDGYGDQNGRCVALPRVTNGHYFGSYLICDDGYGDQNGRCVALPRVANGHYFGSYLICDDGYVGRGDRCARLPQLANGRYLGSVPLCNPGYTYSFTASRCARASSNRTGGGIALCPSDAYAVAGRCFRVWAASFTSTRAAVPTTYTPALCGENGSCYGDISTATHRPKTVYVRSYVRRDGTYVRSHYRSTPRFSFRP